MAQNQKEFGLKVLLALPENTLLCLVAGPFCECCLGSNKEKKVCFMEMQHLLKVNFLLFVETCAATVVISYQRIMVQYLL